MRRGSEEEESFDDGGNISPASRGRFNHVTRSTDSPPPGSPPGCTPTAAFEDKVVDVDSDSRRTKRRLSSSVCGADFLTPRDSRWLRLMSYFNAFCASALHFPRMSEQCFFGDELRLAAFPSQRPQLDPTTAVASQLDREPEADLLIRSPPGKRRAHLRAVTALSKHASTSSPAAEPPSLFAFTCHHSSKRRPCLAPWPWIFALKDLRIASLDEALPSHQVPFILTGAVVGLLIDPDPAWHQGGDSVEQDANSQNDLTSVLSSPQQQQAPGAPPAFYPQSQPSPPTCPTTVDPRGALPPLTPETRLPWQLLPAGSESLLSTAQYSPRGSGGAAGSCSPPLPASAEEPFLCVCLGLVHHIDVPRRTVRQIEGDQSIGKEKKSVESVTDGLSTIAMGGPGGGECG